MRRGFSLLEVTIASSLIIVVLIVIYGLFDSSDKAYWTHVPMKEAQITLQKTLETVSFETQETNTDNIWETAVSGGGLGAMVNEALVWTSARNSSNQYIMDSEGKPVWQRTIALVPVVSPGQTVTLHRFTFTLTPPIGITVTPKIIIASNNVVTLQFLDAGFQVVGTSGGIPASSAVKVVPNLVKFQVTGSNTMANPAGPGSINLDVIRVEIAMTASGPHGSTTVNYQSSVRGRN
jgi:hypothetical protein